MSSPCIKNGTLLARKTQLAAEHTEQYIVGSGLWWPIAKQNIPTLSITYLVSYDNLNFHTWTDHTSQCIVLKL